jgi:hypothetical protein
VAATTLKQKKRHVSTLACPEEVGQCTLVFFLRPGRCEFMQLIRNVHVSGENLLRDLLRPLVQGFLSRCAMPAADESKKERDTSHFSALLADAKNHHCSEDGCAKLRGTCQSWAQWKPSVLPSVPDSSIAFIGDVGPNRSHEARRPWCSSGVDNSSGTDVRCSTCPQGSTE